MNNCEKKLDALIDALGFDVEKIIDTKETPISKQSGLNRIASSALTMTNNDLVTIGQEYKRGTDECYYLKPSVKTDYKVTKRKTPKNISNKINDLDWGGYNRRVYFAELDGVTPASIFKNKHCDIAMPNPVICGDIKYFDDIYIEVDCVAYLSEQNGNELKSRMFTNENI